LSHHGHLSATGYARDALPLLVGWLGATVLFRGRFVPTWLVGVTAGVVLRAAILGHWYAKELPWQRGSSSAGSRPPSDPRLAAGVDV
jgi:hypothetical protein